MLERWVASAWILTEKHFRRIDGHANLWALAAILGRKTETLDSYRKCPGGQNADGRQHSRAGTFDKSVRSEPLSRRAGCRGLWVLNRTFARNARGKVQGPTP
jgi:hypothetical protein